MFHLFLVLLMGIISDCYGSGADEQASGMEALGERSSVFFLQRHNAMTSSSLLGDSPQPAPQDPENLQNSVSQPVLPSSSNAAIRSDLLTLSQPLTPCPSCASTVPVNLTQPDTQPHNIGSN